MRLWQLLIFLLTGAVMLSVHSCEDPEPEEYEIINEWIWEVMTDIYLWADEVDRNLYPTSETDPQAFFRSILNEKDRFSWIVDDYQELINSFDNIVLSTGISPRFARVPESEQVVVIVEYVSQGSPADFAGIRRGDIIGTINGTILDIDNYTDLFYRENVVLGFVAFNGQDFVSNSREITLKAEVIESNPVLYYDMINHEEFLIGYMVYTDFSSGTDDKWLDSLDQVLYYFSEQGATDIIIDLRYNLGGSVSVARHLASVLAPASVTVSQEVFVNYEWNRTYQEYFESNEGETSKNLVIPFEETPAFSLNLENITFLTSGHSASASELLIIGLEPYMHVVQIGEPTYGKCYGSVTIPDFEEPPRHQWAVQPIVFKYANAVGLTDFNDGLEPDIMVEENLLDLKPFGDLSDPMLQAALLSITGSQPAKKRDESGTVYLNSLPDPVRKPLLSSALWQWPD